MNKLLTISAAFLLGISGLLLVPTAAAASRNPYFDGGNDSYNHAASGGTVVISAPHYPDVCVVNMEWGTATGYLNMTGVSGGGLTWYQRASQQVRVGGVYYVDNDEWYAVTSAPLSAVTITATTTTSPGGDYALGVFCLAGANTTPGSIFDPSVKVAVTAVSSSSPVTVSITTSNANDFVYGIAVYEGSGLTPGSVGGVQAATLATDGGLNANAEFIDFGLAISITLTGGVIYQNVSPSIYNAIIGDAIQSSTGAIIGGDSLAPVIPYLIIGAAVILGFGYLILIGRSQRRGVR